MHLYMDKKNLKGTLLRTLTAKGYDDKGQKRRLVPAAGVALFSGPLTNPSIYDMSNTERQGGPKLAVQENNRKYFLERDLKMEVEEVYRHRFLGSGGPEMQAF